MDAGLLDMLHDAGDEGVLAVAEAVDVDFDGIRRGRRSNSSGLSPRTVLIWPVLSFG
jgi:hypothetical protein